MHLWLGQHVAWCDQNGVWCDPRTVTAKTMNCLMWWFCQTWVSWCGRVFLVSENGKNELFLNEYLDIIIHFFKSGKWTFSTPPNH